MTTIARAPVTAAIAAHLLETTGRPGDVGRAPKPEEGRTAPRMPYWILYPLEGGMTGPAQNQESDAAFAYQVTSVGERGDQLERCADRVRAAFLTRNDEGAQNLPVGDDATLMFVACDDGAAGPMDFDGPIGTIPDRFVVHVTNS